MLTAVPASHPPRPPHYTRGVHMMRMDAAPTHLLASMFSHHTPHTHTHLRHRFKSIVVQHQCVEGLQGCRPGGEVSEPAWAGGRTPVHLGVSLE